MYTGSTDRRTLHLIFFLSSLYLSECMMLLIFLTYSASLRRNQQVDIAALMDETDFDMGKLGPISQLAATANYVRRMSECMVKTCPTALATVFARPVTATLPMVTEVYKCARWWDPNRIVGSTALDTMRIESMTASLFDLNPAYLSVPIVGGADPCTVIPLLTKARPVNQFSSVSS